LTSTVQDSTSSTTSATVGLNTVSGNNSFFENKGAVGGTFAAVGLVGVALIGSLIYFINRQRKSRDNDDDDGADLTFPPENPMYPTRDVFRKAPLVDYNDPRSYGMDYPPDTSSFVNTRPVSAAPGTAYAAAITQQGPYQYNPQPAHGHNDTPTATGSNPNPFVDQVSNSGPQDHDDAYAFDSYYTRQ